jgi:hypothetical protein
MFFVPPPGLLLVSSLCSAGSLFAFLLSLSRFAGTAGEAVRLPISVGAVLVTVSLGTAVASGAGGGALADLAHEEAFTAVWGAVSTLCVAIAVPTTHHFEGRHRYRARWALWQPFRGGLPFVALQAVSWTVFGLSLASALTALDGVVCFPAPFARVLAAVSPTPPRRFPMLPSALMGLFSEVAMVLSLRYYQASGLEDQDDVMDGGGEDTPAAAVDAAGRRGPAPATGRAKAAIRPAIADPAIHPWLARLPVGMRFAVELAVVSAIANVHFGFPAVVWLLMALLGPAWGATAVAAVAVLYARTYVGSPELSMRRLWPAVRDARWVYNLLASYFDVSVLLPEHGPAGQAPDQDRDQAENDPDKEADQGQQQQQQQQQFVFGYHPHGVFPLAAVWLGRSSVFRAAYPGVEITPLGSSAFFWPPVLRDVAMWGGARPVARVSGAAFFFFLIFF